MEISPISPVSAKPMWDIAIVCLFLVSVMGALACTLYSSRHPRVEVHTDRIKLVGDYWGRDIPFEKLTFSGEST